MALVGARNAANALNRLIDARIDAANPRTADRHLPQGLVSGKEVLLISIAGFALFLLASWQLNPLCFKLAPVALFIMVIYSYTKKIYLGLPPGAGFCLRNRSYSQLAGGYRKLCTTPYAVECGSDVLGSRI